MNAFIVTSCDQFSLILLYNKLLTPYFWMVVYYFKKYKDYLILFYVVLVT